MEPLTKADLLDALQVFRGDIRADLTSVRSELQANLASVRTDLASVRSELGADLASVQSELRAEFRADLTVQKDQLTELMRQIESNLLTEFHRYAKGLAGPLAYARSQVIQTCGSALQLLRNACSLSKCVVRRRLEGY